jgi:hypothetical protein
MKRLAKFRVKVVEEGKHRLGVVFEGLEESTVLQRIFGERLNEMIDATSIEVNRHPWIIWVDEEGVININANYLRETDRRTLYLDIVHEMIHVKQLADGKKLFDNSFGYADRPTEIEAYRLTVEEAQEIGLSREEIVDYLRVDWISDEEHQRLVRAVMK